MPMLTNPISTSNHREEVDMSYTFSFFGEWSEEQRARWAGIGISLGHRPEVPADIVFLFVDRSSPNASQVKEVAKLLGRGEKPIVVLMATLPVEGVMWDLRKSDVVRSILLSLPYTDGAITALFKTLEERGISSL